MAPVGTPQKSQWIAPSKSPDALIREALEAIPKEEATHCSRFFTTDLKDFLRWLTEIEQRCTPEVAATSSLRQEVDERWSAIIRRGEEALGPIPKPIARKAVKAAFRKAVQPWFANNPFISRALEKPRGYPGDYLMMERFYRNEHELSGGLAGVLDRFILDHYESVRNRKDRSKACIRHHAARLAMSGQPIRILSLGSGPCREWFELAQELGPDERQRFSKVHLTCLDQDEEALEFCRSRLSDNPLLASVDYARASLIGFTRSEQWIQQAGTFDLVYGFGIADYFYDEMLSSIIASAFSLVKEGGDVSIPHKATESFNYELADWICDWTFVRRTQEEFVTLFRHAVSMLRIPFDFSIDREPTGEIMFATARRLR